MCSTLAFPALGEIKKKRVHADGNKAWKSQALKQGFQFSAATHVRMQFTRHVRSKKLVTGTQKLDGIWKLLKKFVAPQLRTRNPENRRVAKHLLDTVKVSCSDTTVGANSGVSLASWRKKTCDFCLQMTVKIHGKHSQNKKRVCRLAPAMRISNRNLDTSDKNALNSTICLQSR